MKLNILFNGLLAFVLTLAVLFGSGVIMEKTGVVLVPTAYACGSSTGGGC